uniref:Peptidase S1 domain-containing protein n=1 Tax=Strongyloides venezuelensis TaxID=75913 RepID=A0A0K0F1B8_STRVS
MFKFEFCFIDEANCGKSDYLNDFESSFKRSGALYGIESRVESGIPWMARIIDYNKTTICNGILVTQLHVLTNFGCLEGIEKLIKQQSEHNHLYGRYQVRIGELSDRDICDSHSDGIFNCSSKVIIRYINVLHLPHPVLDDDLKYGVIELNRPVTSIPHACIYQYQMDFLGLEEEKKVENVISLMWGIDNNANFDKFELKAYFYKETFDYKNKRFADSFGCKIREDYLMVIEEFQNKAWKNVFKGAPLLRKVKYNQFGVYGIGEDTCIKNFNKEIKHIQELFFVTFKSAQYFLFDSLNEVNHDEEYVGNEFYDISKFYDEGTCGMVRKRDNFKYKSDYFENEAFYPWILTITKGDLAFIIRYINVLHLPHPVLDDDLKYGVIELNRPVTSIPHACIYQYQMDFLGLEEEKKVENVISLMWGIDNNANFDKFELKAYFYKETFDYKNKRFADSFGCKIREDYLMVIEEFQNKAWKKVFKGAPLLRKVKYNQFGVYGIGEDTCIKNFNKEIKHIQELFFVTFKSAQYFLFDSLNEVNHNEEYVGNEFYDISKFYDKDICKKIHKENLSDNSDSFTNEVSYP